jgi:hypothetical protein
MPHHQLLSQTILEHVEHAFNTPGLQTRRVCSLGGQQLGKKSGKKAMSHQLHA